MITPAQFEGIRQKMLHYLYRHQHDGRGPSCTACLRAGNTHSGKDQPVCLTVEELLADLKKLVDETTADDTEKMQKALELALPVLRGNADEALRKAALEATLACGQEPVPKAMAVLDPAGAFQFLISYIDQHGLIRSTYVEAAKDEADAIAKGQTQLMNALRLQIPAPVTRGMSLKLANIERGFLSPVGWVRDREWRNKR